MATALSPIRIARIRRTSVPAVAETAELDFALGVDEGVEIYSARLVMEEAIDTPDGVFDTDWAFASLHVETGGLERDLDDEQDENILNSEVIAQACIQKQASTLAGGDMSSYVWVAPPVWDYLAILGQPLLVASNLTARFLTKDANFVMNGVEWVIFYRYVKLTQQELAGLFIQRR